MSLLISLAIQSWWLVPSVDPAAVTASAAACGSSRWSIQPRIAPWMSLTAVSAYSSSDSSRSVSAQIASCSIAVPTSFQSMTEKSSGW